ncbi:MAG: GspE/PulE family protein [Planctomycetota bacterium]
MARRRLIGEILQRLGYCKDKDIQRGLTYQQQHGGLIGEALIQLGIIDEVKLTKGLAKQNGVPFVNLAKGQVPGSVLEAVPREVADEHGIIPVKASDEGLIVAAGQPLDPFTLDNLRFALNANIKWALAAPTDFARAQKKYYGAGGEAAAVAGGAEAVAVAAAPGEADDAPIIRLVEKIISDAARAKASDIHVEPLAERLRVRYRIDGMCHEVDGPPKSLQGPVLSRLKLMANMDLSEKRKPQDGRIKFPFQGRSLDLRVSALPAYHGESLVMRILDKEESLVSLQALGFEGEDFKRFQSIIERPNGIFLVTGPTGSGKTTTLYAALSELNQTDVKIITAEDPVEYHLEGINQCQVLRKIGMDFARILRAMLRQAPNIILVGEIRDLETAEIAIQAALTGHLVFSTLHTNDAPSALSRLIDLGVKPFLVSSSIQAVMAQRLLRRLCHECREAYNPTDVELRAVGLSKAAIKKIRIYRPGGCDQCMGTGYKGRIGIYELMEMSGKMRQMIFNMEPMEKIRTEASVSGGMTTLQGDGLRKVLQGVTTLEEVLRITQRSDIL